MDPLPAGAGLTLSELWLERVGEAACSWPGGEGAPLGAGTGGAESRGEGRVWGRGWGWRSMWGRWGVVAGGEGTGPPLLFVESEGEKMSASKDNKTRS